jgi:hypothetical protein
MAEATLSWSDRFSKTVCGLAVKATDVVLKTPHPQRLPEDLGYALADLLLSTPNAKIGVVALGGRQASAIMTSVKERIVELGKIELVFKMNPAELHIKENPDDAATKDTPVRTLWVAHTKSNIRGLFAQLLVVTSATLVDTSVFAFGEIIAPLMSMSARMIVFESDLNPLPLSMRNNDEFAKQFHFATIE